MKIEHLEIDEVGTWANGETGTQGIQFSWVSNIGFGELTFYLYTMTVTGGKPTQSIYARVRIRNLSR